MNSTNKTILLLAVGLALFSVIYISISPDTTPNSVLKKFSSEQEFFDALQKSSAEQFVDRGVLAGLANLASASSKTQFSRTNIQVENVDEADIVKTDGKYIYSIQYGKFVITRAYPAEKAKIVFKKNFSDFVPSQIFINNDRAILFGQKRDSFDETYARIYDISDKTNPKLLKSFDIKGSYLTSRMIDSYVYFVAVKEIGCGAIHRIVGLEMKPECSVKDVSGVANFEDIYYFNKNYVQNLLVVGSISLDSKKMKTIVVAGTNPEVYASEKGIYLAQPLWQGGKTTVVKIEMKDGRLIPASKAVVRGYPLNQFSMDENKGYFRIATHTENHFQGNDDGTNVYVLDKNMKLVGELEGLAKGEQFYSARFIGDRVYLVTFKYVDPLFVIDLSNPKRPAVLGKLKIPGYSVYLHPYDKTHLIGLGYDVNESIDKDKVHNENAIYYTAITGLKLALFDVSDVAHPKEVSKYVIEGRDSYSEALTDHHAFLFSKEKNLLAIPVTKQRRFYVMNPGSKEQNYSEFYGTYVFSIDSGNIKLKAQISQEHSKAGYGGVKRILYINDVLYTLSEECLQLNSLKNYRKIKSFCVEPSYYFRQIYYTR